jgi:glycosyltransferase involved in cell wall biosynthesis
MVLIDSVYINKSGGKVLLEYLIKCIIEKKIENNFFFLLDNRIDISNTIKLELLNVEYLVPSEKSRRDFYNKNIDLYSSIFCFANVPPPIFIKDKLVSIYFHNVLLANFFKANLSILDIINLIIKKWYIKLINYSNYTWITQTPSIKNLLVDKIGIRSRLVKVMPFFDIIKFHRCNDLKEENYTNYLYVADSSKQKNHLSLLLAWEKFTQFSENMNFTLHLTLSVNSSKKILDKIDFLKSTGRKIVNHKDCSVEEIRELYQNCNYFIFPSLAESFGLPLIEAASAGCKVIASNLPYVFNVIEPSLVFNPNDEQSIFNSLISSKDYSNVKNTKLLVENNIDQLLNTINYV